MHCGRNICGMTNRFILAVTNSWLKKLHATMTLEQSTWKNQIFEIFHSVNFGSPCMLNGEEGTRGVEIVVRRGEVEKERRMVIERGIVCNIYGAGCRQNRSPPPAPTFFFVLCGEYRLKNVEILLSTLSFAIPFSHLASLGAILQTQFLLPCSLSKFLVMFCKLDCRNLWRGPTVGLHILKHSSINLRLNFRKVRKLL